MFPRAFHNNSLCKIWRANKVNYGQLENRECAVLGTHCIVVKCTASIFFSHGGLQVGQ